MAMAVALVVIVVAALLFHFLSPWWITPIASNWKTMDDTLTITLVITGIFFVAINLFVVYMLMRFSHREGRRAHYQPENRRLEVWLIAGTTLGIVLLLAPGLFVYAEYVRPPPGALELEAIGTQWQWRFRFRGEDGKLGRSDIRFVSAANPFGLDPDDPDALGNVLIDSNEVHVPLNKPLKVLLRSHDVLHDFYVPQFRARMNMVPGMVTSFWFTPTKPGRYEILCSQLCGVGHYNMRGYIVVEDEAAFQAWLKSQPTFAATMQKTSAPGTTGGAGDKVSLGKVLAQAKGCTACHSTDGSPGVGPTLKGLYGKSETLADGTTAIVDEAYLKDSIVNPTARVVKGYAPIMPKVELTDGEVAALVAYIETFGSAPPGGVKQ
ncbi:MAG TPA: cytochrome c oxidase subunit II [Paucimonas sp.]|nr:cytochrome c oxidase subunit II [Paucimonas sp.]